jgi:hypothetical protein
MILEKRKQEYWLDFTENGLVLCMIIGEMELMIVATDPIW